MLSILLIVLSFFFGITTLQLTKVSLYKIELFSLAWVIGLFGVAWLSFFFSWFLPITQALWTSVFMGCVYIGLFLRKKKFQTQVLTQNEAIYFKIFFYLSAVFFLYLLFTHLFQAKTDGWYSGGGAWGDLAIHSTYTSYFAAQTKLNLTNPIFASEKTTYPFMINWYAALLYRLGASLQWSLLLTSFLSIFAATQLLYGFVLRASKSSFIAILSNVLFFANGGFGFYYFWLDWQKSDVTLWQFIWQQKLEYAHLADMGIHWSNVVADYVLPQRGFVIGLAIFLTVLVLWQNYWQTGNKRILLFSSLFIGLSPLFHTHTYITLLGLFPWVALGVAFKNKTKHYFFLAALGLITLIIVSFPQLFWQFSHTHAAHFTELKWGWMKDDEKFLFFWLKNMGLSFVFLTLGSLYFFFKIHGYRLVKLLLMPLLILFAVTNMVSFQPHVYDNMKFMLYSYLLVSIVTAILLERLWQRQKLMTLVIIFLLTITGILSIVRESYTSWKLVDNEDIAIAQKIAALTEPNAVILTSSEHNHPVPMLAGRAVLMGYPGWLWTHGINYRPVETDIAVMYAGGPKAKTLLEKYGVDYVYIGRNEKEKLKANEVFFAMNYKKIPVTKDAAMYITH